MTAPHATKIYSTEKLDSRLRGNDKTGRGTKAIGTKLVRHAARTSFANANEFSGTFANRRNPRALPEARVRHFFITLFAIALGAPFALVGANLTFLFGSIATGLTGAVIGFAAGAFLGHTMGKIVVQTIRISPAVMAAVGRLLIASSKPIKSSA